MMCRGICKRPPKISTTAGIVCLTPPPLQGLSLEEADLRRLTGVTLMAIRREAGEMVDYPEPGTLMMPGDRLLLVGEPDEITAFENLATGEAPVPTKNLSCQWVAVPPHSPAMGKTLADLDLSHLYGVQVQVIRRDGKFVRFPDGRADLQSGDRLLLCGTSDQLQQMKYWLHTEDTASPFLDLPTPSDAESDETGATLEMQH